MGGCCGPAGAGTSSVELCISNYHQHFARDADCGCDSGRACTSGGSVVSGSGHRRRRPGPQHSVMTGEWCMVTRPPRDSADAASFPPPPLLGSVELLTTFVDSRQSMVISSLLRAYHDHHDVTRK